MQGIGQKAILTVKAVRIGAAALTVAAFALAAGATAPAAWAQDTPKGIEGSTPGLEGGGGADPKSVGPGETGPDKAGMPPGGAMPPDKRAAPPVVAGAYSLVGRNLNGSSYTGRVAVTATGETYRVVWRVGTQTFVGVGILTGDILSVAYNGGLAVYRFSPQGIRGRWATTNATRIATEDWTRR